MSARPDAGSDPARLQQALQHAAAHLVEREGVAELMVLAAVAREHLLLIGPPGTAKSAVARRVAQALGGRYFEYLLGRFTEPSELFGPIDLRRLREGVVATETTGMLPEAEIAFLDEVFLGSTAILNSLLGILNERSFRRGHTRIDCPLQLCIGAANALPEDEALAAFADRFLLHAFVEPVPDHQLEALLDQGWQADHEAIASCADIGVLRRLQDAAARVELLAVRGLLAEAIRQLRRAGIQLSDRRIVKAQGLLAAAAALAGRTHADASDLWPLVCVVPTAAAQATAREALADLLGSSCNARLQHAAEAATRQPMARLPRLLDRGRALLLATDSVELEAWLREVDANFAAAALPPELSGLRTELAARLAQLEFAA